MTESNELAVFWQLACTSARNHASATAGGCRKKAADLIRREVASFCDRQSPTSRNELTCRQREVTYLISRIGSISHADRMARSHPGVSDGIMQAVRDFLDRVAIDQSPYKEAMTLMATISTLCHSDVMQSL